MNDQAIVLPPAIVTKRDVASIINEFESVDNELTAAEVRAHAGAAGGVYRP